MKHRVEKYIFICFLQSIFDIVKIEKQIEKGNVIDMEESFLTFSFEPKEKRTKEYEKKLGVLKAFIEEQTTDKYGFTLTIHWDSDEENEVTCDEDDNAVLHRIGDKLTELFIDYNGTFLCYLGDTLLVKSRNGVERERFVHPHYETPYVSLEVIQKLVDRYDDKTIVSMLKEHLQKCSEFEAL